MNEYKEHSEDEKLNETQAAEETATADQTEPVKEGSKRFSARVFVQIMNGEILTRDYFLKNLPFTFFIGFLFVVVIAWGYYGETVAKREVQLEKELGELNSEFYTLTAEYNAQRGRRQIALRLESTGVKESVMSPRKIRVRKYVFP